MLRSMIDFHTSTNNTDLWWNQTRGLRDDDPPVTVFHGDTYLIPADTSIEQYLRFITSVVNDLGTGVEGNASVDTTGEGDAASDTVDVIRPRRSRQWGVR